MVNYTESFIILHTLLQHGRIAGIEPASSPWQREILPFDHIRIFSFLIRTYTSTHNIYDILYYVWIIFVQGQAGYYLQLQDDSNPIIFLFIFFIFYNYIIFFFSFKKFDPSLQFFFCFLYFRDFY